MVDNSFPGWDEGIQPLDELGLFYVVFTLGWTGLLGCGTIWMFMKRKLPSFKIRNIPLALGALCVLHIYWIVYMLGYPLKSAYSCTMEFWMMSIALPFGVALFQANNMQLLNTARLQRRFMESDTASLSPAGQRIGSWSFRPRLAHLSFSRQTAIAIMVGMVVQVCVPKCPGPTRLVV